MLLMEDAIIPQKTFRILNNFPCLNEFTIISIWFTISPQKHLDSLKLTEKKDKIFGKI